MLLITRHSDFTFYELWTNGEYHLVYKQSQGEETDLLIAYDEDARSEMKFELTLLIVIYSTDIKI